MGHMPWIWLVFIIFMMLTTFSVMNVILAVIVESVLESAVNHKAEVVKQHEAETRKAGMKVDEVFRATDADGDGQITKDEFLEALKRDDVHQYLQDVGIDVRQAENLFDILDFDDSGALDATEFTSGVLKARGGARAKDVLTVQCNLWKSEQVIRRQLAELCKTVDARMENVDKEMD